MEEEKKKSRADMKEEERRERDREAFFRDIEEDPEMRKEVCQVISSLG